MVAWDWDRAVSAFLRVFRKKVGDVQGVVNTDSVASHPVVSRKAWFGNRLELAEQRAKSFYFLHGGEKEAEWVRTLPSAGRNYRIGAVAVLPLRS